MKFFYKTNLEQNEHRTESPVIKTPYPGLAAPNSTNSIGFLEFIWHFSTKCTSKRTNLWLRSSLLTASYASCDAHTSTNGKKSKKNDLHNRTYLLLVSPLPTASHNSVLFKCFKVLNSIVRKHDMFWIKIEYTAPCCLWHRIANLLCTLCNVW